MSPPGDIIGKITAGYQAWFMCPGDRATINTWFHWAKDHHKPMTDDNVTVISWPAMQCYNRSFKTEMADCPNGQPATLFSSWDEQTIFDQLRMMAYAGVHTVAVQRFNPTGDHHDRPFIDQTVDAAAISAGRKWYCMYDVSGWKNMRKDMVEDWKHVMSPYTRSPAYAYQNGKPVVCIWGFGFNDENHPFTTEECLEVINFFKNEAGCYVIGGVPTWWRRDNGDSRSGYGEVYRAFNCLSPWMIGRASDAGGLNGIHNDGNVPDFEECARCGIDYQPCVMPGDLSQGDRKHGDFYWHHMYLHSKLLTLPAAQQAGLGIYVSMFDEYNEGNQIAPTAENKSQQPANFKGRALDEDGVACTADYYLRLTNAANAMFYNPPPLPRNRFTEPWPGKGLFLNTSRRVSITACINSKFVCAERGGQGNLISNRTNVGPWEAFTLEYPDPNDDTKVAIKACNGKYVSFVESHLRATADKISSVEIFTMEPMGGAAVAFKAHNGRYVQSKGDCDINIGPEKAAWWETFEVKDV